MTHRKAQFKLWCLLIFVLFPSQRSAIASENRYDNFKEIGSAITDTVIKDYKNFYTRERWIRIGIGFGIGAVVANSNLDNKVQNWYQDDVRSSGTDDVAKNVKWIGEGLYLIPISLVSASFKYFDQESRIGNWGEHCARAYLAGSPVLLFMQRATGGSRPGETSHDSKWRLFNDSNGVSGHAFIGAVPFLTIGKMNKDNNYLKYTAYVASALTAWSRLNDNDHYLSQVALGWYLAWESVDAVFDADKPHRDMAIVPLMGQKSYGIMVNWTR